MAQAAKLECSGPFMAAWEDFIACYGARGPAEIDIASPCWYENPLPVLRVIAAYTQKEMNGRSQFEALARSREAAFARLLKAAGRSAGCACAFSSASTMS